MEDTGERQVQEEFAAPMARSVRAIGSVHRPTRASAVMLAQIRCNWLLGCAPPRKGFSPVRGKLGTPNAPPHETRLVHLPS